MNGKCLLVTLAVCNTENYACIPCTFMAIKKFVYSCLCIQLCAPCTWHDARSMVIISFLYIQISLTKTTIKILYHFWTSGCLEMVLQIFMIYLKNIASKLVEALCLERVPNTFSQPPNL